jgi:hypothetical protein
LQAIHSWLSQQALPQAFSVRYFLHGCGSPPLSPKQLPSLDLRQNSTETTFSGPLIHLIAALAGNTGDTFAWPRCS